MSLVTFDMDGVLADTRKAVAMAYLEAGVEFPASAWGKPYSGWLSVEDAHTVHRIKQAAYPKMLNLYASPLPGTQVLRQLQVRGHSVHVVTNASERSARDVLGWLGLEDVQFTSTPNKRSVLIGLRPVCHIDDFPVDGCPVPFVQFFANMTAKELMEAVEVHLA